MSETKDLMNADEITADKLELLAYILEEEGIELSETNVISPRKTDGPAPLSSSQVRLWFLDQLAPNSSLYNISGSLVIEGRLDTQVLARALSEIVRRHEILRTAFHAENGTPVQVVLPARKTTVVMIDLRGLLEEQQEAAVSRITEQEADRPFDLTSGSLLRPVLLRLAEDKQILLLTMHHIIMDGWAINLFVDEFVSLYEAYVAGKTSPLPELPIQYGDYAAWQQEWLRSETIERHFDYWKEQLAGRLPVLELPTDRPRPAIPSTSGGHEFMVIPKPVADALKDLNRREEVTLFITLLAVFMVLLSRYSRQEDLIVGSPALNREREQVKNLIGLFVNAMIIRVDLSGDPTFRELLKRVRKVTLEAYDHWDVPFEKLVEVLQPARDNSYTPLFQVNLAVHTDPLPTLEFAGLKLKVKEVVTSTSKFDLTLELTEHEGSLKGWIEYRSDLFEPGTIGRMVTHLKTLLSSITRNPDEHISRLDLLPEEEHRQITVEWNKTGTEFSEPDCLHEMFEEQVEVRGGNTAVVFEGKKVTYAELNGRANRLAGMLRERGVGPEVLVGICVERSFEMVVALLAVLKAGGAYVPLDPDYPSDRLAYILEDSGAQILVTQEKVGLQEKVNWDGSVIDIDREWEEVAKYEDGNVGVGVEPDSLAYVIYTSGSTGKPKGAMLTHRGIRNRLLWGIKDYELGVGDAVLNKTPLSFDVSVWEIFAPLCSGATLVVARGGGQQDTGYLVRLIQNENVTHIDFVPSMLQFFLQEKGVENCSSLKRVTAAGEALTRDLVERFHSVLQADLYNLYGPTETSLAVTYWNCEAGNDRRVIPIGRPMTNAAIYIIDSKWQPVPIGVPGEIYIGGIPLGRGYHNRPDLTADTFIPDPFSGIAGARIYRTGDLARYRDGGEIEFLGRIDNQVKVRGYRIELGEVEAFLGGHEKVRDAVAVVRETEAGEKKLVAYVVKEGQEGPGELELRKYMRELVPEYMVPSEIVVLEEMPLTVNGKVDRAALPARDGGRPELEEGYLGPRNEMEERLAAIWGEVLGVNEIGVRDSFFDLGGHSLLAIQLMLKVTGELGLELPLSTLFLTPTIEGFAEAIAQAGRSATRARRPAISPVPRDAYRARRSSHEVSQATKSTLNTKEA